MNDETVSTGDNELDSAWLLCGPTEAEVMEQAELLHVEQGDGSMLVWVRFPQDDAEAITNYPPPIRPVDRPDSYIGWLTVPVESSTTVHERRQAVGLPPHPFLYTVDQIADMLQRNKTTIIPNLHFSGVTPGKCPEGKMLCANLAGSGEGADWRVADSELIRWLRHKGFKVYDAWTLSAY